MNEVRYAEETAVPVLELTESMEGDMAVIHKKSTIDLHVCNTGMTDRNVVQEVNNLTESLKLLKAQLHEQDVKFREMEEDKERLRNDVEINRLLMLILCIVFCVGFLALGVFVLLVYSKIIAGQGTTCMHKLRPSLHGHVAHLDIGTGGSIGDISANQEESDSHEILGQYGLGNMGLPGNKLEDGVEEVTNRGSAEALVLSRISWLVLRYITDIGCSFLDISRYHLIFFCVIYFQCYIYMQIMIRVNLNNAIRALFSPGSVMDIPNSPMNTFFFSAFMCIHEKIAYVLRSFPNAVIYLVRYLMRRDTYYTVYL